MAHYIEASKVFIGQWESHYQQISQIDPAIPYPQYHDFFEVILVMEGAMKMNISGLPLLLPAGSLMLIRPGDIHSKWCENCTHINLAFQAEIIDALYDYLCDEPGKETLMTLPNILPIHLPHEKLHALAAKIKLLYSVDITNWPKARTMMRSILFEIIKEHIFPATVFTPSSQALPKWLDDALKQWQKEENRHEGLAFFCQRTGYAKEHLCRVFKKHFGLSSTKYLNQQRLTFAMNLLLHTDYNIIDIAFASGFKSASRFYHVFRSAYGISPKQFVHQKLNESQP